MKLYIIVYAFVFLSVFIIGCSKKEKKHEPVSAYSYKAVVLKKNVTWSKDDEKRKQIKKGMIIEKESYIETGEGSLLLLEGSLGDRVVLGEKCKIKLTLEELSIYANTDNINVRGLRILKGMAFFDIRKLIGGFFVETPSAFVKVKGTRFSVKYNEKEGTTNVSVIDGEVEVNDKGKVEKPAKTYFLKKGEKIEGVKLDRKPEKSKIKDKEIKNGFWQTVIFPSKEETKKIQKKLDKETEGLRGKATGVEKTRAKEDLINERKKSQKEMDGVRIKYAKDKEKMKADFSEHKQKARQDFDSVKSASKQTLDEERKKFNSEKQEKRRKLDAEREKFSKEKSGLSDTDSGKSDDAFDELKRRKMRNR